MKELLDVISPGLKGLKHLPIEYALLSEIRLSEAGQSENGLCENRQSKIGLSENGPSDNGPGLASIGFHTRWMVTELLKTLLAV